MEANRRKYHEKIARYFDHQKLTGELGIDDSVNIRKCLELVWQQVHAQMWDEAINTVCDLLYIQAKSSVKLTSDLLQDINLIYDKIPDAEERRSKMSRENTKLDGYINSILLHRGDAAGELYSVWPIENDEIEHEIEALIRTEKRLDKLDDFYQFLGDYMYFIDRNTFRFENYAFQCAWNYAGKGPVGAAASELEERIDTEHLLLSRNRPEWKPRQAILKVFDPDSINTAILSPDNTKAILCKRLKNTMPGTGDSILVSVFSISSGELITSFKFDSEFACTQLTYSGRYLLLYNYTKKLELWDIVIGKQVYVLNGIDGNIQYASVDGEGEGIYILVSGELRKYEVDTGLISIPIEMEEHDVFYRRTVDDIMEGNKKDSSIVRIETYSLGRDVCCLMKCGELLFWNLESGKQTNRMKLGTEEQEWIDLCITASGKFALILTNTEIILVSIEKEEILSRFKHAFASDISRVYEIRMTEDAKIALISSQGNLLLYDIYGQKELRRYTGYGIYGSLSLCPDGRFALYNGYYLNLESGKSYIQETNYTGKTIPELRRSPNGRWGLEIKRDKLLRIDIVSGTCDWEIPLALQKDTSLVFDIEGLAIICVNAQNQVLIINAENGHIESTYSPVEKMIYSINISADMRYLFIGLEYSEILMWDRKVEMEVFRFKGHRKYNTPMNSSRDDYPSKVLEIVPSPDGTNMLSMNDSAEIFQWNLLNGKADHWFTLGGLYTGHPTFIGYDRTGSDFCFVEDRLRNVKQLVKDSITARQYWEYPEFANAKFITSDNYIISEYKSSIYIMDVSSGREVELPPLRFEISSLDLAGDELMVSDTQNRKASYRMPSEWKSSEKLISSVRSMWDSEERKYKAYRVFCPNCSHQMRPSNMLLEELKGLREKYTLSDEQSFSLHDQSALWENEKLLIQCKECHKVIRVNPFITYSGELNIETIMGRRYHSTEKGHADASILHLEEEDETPFVHMDAKSSKILVSGRLTTKQYQDFSDVLIGFLKKGFSENSSIEVHFAFEYFSTHGIGVIMDFLSELKEFEIAGSEVKVNWYYPDDDDGDMFEAGEDIESLSDLEFSYLPAIDEEEFRKL